MESSKISIITVTYNSELFLKGYFESIAENIRGSSEFQVEVLIYDAGSSDNTVKIINDFKKSNGYIKLIEGKNIGFAAANNILAKECGGDYLFILNPDTKLDKECLHDIWKDKQRDNAILAPKQVYFDGIYLNNGVGMDIFGYPYGKSGKKVFYADGAAIFIKKSIFFDLGMFDNDYFMFQEDIDLSWRAHLVGIPITKVPEAIVWHFSGGSVGGGAIKGGKLKTKYFRRYLGERNIMMNLLKNYSLPNLLWILPINFLINIAEIILFLLLLKPGVAWQYIKAYCWILVNFKDIIDKRRKIQETRIVSDGEIMQRMYWGSSKLKILLKAGVPKFK